MSGLLASGFFKTGECLYLLRIATGLELPLKPDVGPLTKIRSSEYFIDSLGDLEDRCDRGS